MTKSSTIRLQAPYLERTLSVIGDLAAEGAGSEVADRWTSDAALEVGDGRDVRRVLQVLADRVRRTVTFKPDEYGGENVQPIDRTLEGLRTGDCDDFTVAMLALGRRAGLRGGVEVFHKYPREGVEAPPVAVHILPAFENPARPGEWFPVELTDRIPLGTKPDLGPGHWTIHAMQESDAGQLGGFLDVVGTFLNPIGSVVSGIFGAKAAKDTAKENRKADEAKARAAADVGKASAAADVRVAELNRASLSDTIAFGKDALSLLFKLGLVVTVGSLAKQMLTRRRVA